ncbi:helix-turn-helix domain-containing protein [Flagellimonas pacifica]|uniref:DNA-binding transcriptional regulator, XRE-family HTH domain n=1 Tax=Flagellimonas pacifica TaxID=1247520 RepID=A0A285MWP3_9FLAO|nr:helix-turn-helix transcriptional regulator [Allomuricauda parva]SNZ01620.1 DNA-binding transcriptional regulator, XRE-family HTH domain [Allomuricauda parva]
MFHKTSKLVIYDINYGKYKPFLDLSNMASVEKSEILKKIGENVKRIRVEKGLTQVDLVGKIEARIDTTNISRIEKGRTNATIHTLFRISQALEVPLSEICTLD